MSDFRDPSDPLWRGGSYEPATRGNNVSWGWIAGALVLAVLVAIAFGARHPTQTASNETSTPAASQSAPPVAAPHTSPGLPGLTPPPAQGNTQPR
mgnify:CR=1 FL=1